MNGLVLPGRRIFSGIPAPSRPGLCQTFIPKKNGVGVSVAYYSVFPEGTELGGATPQAIGPQGKKVMGEKLEEYICRIVPGDALPDYGMRGIKNEPLKHEFRAYLTNTLKKEPENLQAALRKIFNQEYIGPEKIINLLTLAEDFPLCFKMLDMLLLVTRKKTPKALYAPFQWCPMCFFTRAMFRIYLQPSLRLGEVVEVIVEDTSSSEGIRVAFSKDIEESLYVHSLVHVKGILPSSFKDVFPNIEMGTEIRLKITDIRWDGHDSKLCFTFAPEQDIFNRLTEENFSKEEMPLIGQETVGRIESITSYGIFVRLPGGQTGLLSTKELSWRSGVNVNALRDTSPDPAGRFIPVKVRNIEYNWDKRKFHISLSLSGWAYRELLPEEIQKLMSDPKPRYNWQEMVETVKKHYKPKSDNQALALMLLAEIYNQKSLWEKIISHEQESGFYGKLNQDILDKLIDNIDQYTKDDWLDTDKFYRQASDFIAQAWPSGQ